MSTIQVQILSLKRLSMACLGLWSKSALGVHSRLSGQHLLCGGARLGPARAWRQQSPQLSHIFFDPIRSAADAPQVLRHRIYDAQVKVSASFLWLPE